MTDRHFADFIAAIRTGEPLRQPVAQGNVAVTLMQLSNVSYFTGRTIHVDSATGSVRDDAEAERMTRRTYEPGWEPKGVGKSRTFGHAESIETTLRRQNAHAVPTHA